MKAILSTKNIKKSFKQNDRQDLLVLDNVNITLHEGEIVAVLGRTGAGKSTLLRIIAGLVRPTSGQVTFDQTPVEGPTQGMSMIFQDFALLPWLSVLQNVELGLEAQGLPAKERRERALKAIDIVGMDGFESALPKELSGGMCQRVGFARALVVNPKLLLMDEPFSSLDVLTSEGLRNDLLDIWQSEKTHIKSILLVTHNIEEAVSLADRILIFGANPGSVHQDIKVNIPHPRNEHEQAVHQLMDDIYTAIADASNHTKPHGAAFRTIDLYYRLPHASVSEMTGLMEALDSAEFEDHVELAAIAEAMHLDVDELFPLTEALELLRFARVKEGEITLTPSGRMFAKASILDQKKIFATQLMSHIPLARHIRHILDERPSHTATQDRFLQELEDYLSEEASLQVFTTVIDWSRYAELFAFDFNTKLISLENPS